MNNSQSMFFMFCIEQVNAKMEHVRLIQENYRYLLDHLDLRYTDLIDGLLENGVIDETEKQQLENESTIYHRNQKFLSLMFRKSSEDFQTFLDLLKTSDNAYIVGKITGVPVESEGEEEDDQGETSTDENNNLHDAANDELNRKCKQKVHELEAQIEGKDNVLLHVR